MTKRCANCKKYGDPLICFPLFRKQGDILIQSSGPSSVQTLLVGISSPSYEALFYET